MFDDDLLIVGLLVHFFFVLVFYRQSLSVLLWGFFFSFHIKYCDSYNFFYDHHYYYYHYYYFVLLSDCFPFGIFHKILYLSGNLNLLVCWLSLLLLYFYCIPPPSVMSILPRGQQFDRRIQCICLDDEKFFLHVYTFYSFLVCVCVRLSTYF